MTRSSMSSRWYSRPQPITAPRARLICFPHAGRGGTMFRSWNSLLPPEIELCTVNLPGRESRFDDPLVTAMDPLADTLLTELKPLWTDVPVTLFGHSMGALIAVEMCRRLEERGSAPSHLVVSGCAPPQRPQPRLPMTGLSDAEFVARLRDLAGTAAELLDNAAAMELLLPVLRADYRLAEDYQRAFMAHPGPPLDCPITVLSAPADPETAGCDLSDWAALSTDRCRLREFKGGHFFLETSRPLVVAAVTAAVLST